MSIEIETTCPLGSECETVKDGKVQRCAWYVALKGNDPQTDESFDEWRCAMAWQPILMVNTGKETNRVSDGIQRLRNEMSPVANLMAQAKVITDAAKVPATNGVCEEGS